MIMQNFALKDYFLNSRKLTNINRKLLQNNFEL